MYSKTGIPLWEEMTWKDIEEILKKTNICAMPVGAIEQHGPHLPLGTDTFIAQEIVCRACAVLKKRDIHVCVGPSVPFGVHPEAMHYPGSVQIMPRTLLELIKDICCCLKDMGFEKILLLVGHDGNVPAMQTAVQELQIEKDLDVMCVRWIIPHLEDQARILPLDGRDGHGGARETSRALHSFEDLVKMDKASPYTAPLPPPKKVRGTASSSVVYRPIAVEAMQYYPATHPGQDGDPTLASADAGDQLYDALGSWLADVIVQEYGIEG